MSSQVIWRTKRTGKINTVKPLVEFIISKVASIYSKTLLKSDVIQRFWNGQLQVTSYNPWHAINFPLLEKQIFEMNLSEYGESKS